MCAAAAAPVIGFSPAMAEAEQAIKAFLYPRMYRHDAGDAGDGRRPQAWCAICSRIIIAIARPIAGGMAERPDGRRRRGRARRVGDFIAGMTDRYALPNTRASLTRPRELR